jgi:monothiol glutaredoxin
MALVVQLTVLELKAMRDRGEAFELVDVRTEGERELARIEGSRLLDQTYYDELARRERHTLLVFQCHHGIRSQAAAEHFAGLGFEQVYNLQGGIDAWSRQVDPAIRRY